MSSLQRQSKDPPTPPTPSTPSSVGSSLDGDDDQSFTPSPSSTGSPDSASSLCLGKRKQVDEDNTYSSLSNAKQQCTVHTRSRTLQLIVVDNANDFNKEGLFKPCTLFGFDRTTKYRGYFFCQHCSIYEANRMAGLTASRSSRRNECQAFHWNLVYPSDKKEFHDEYESFVNPAKLLHPFHHRNAPGFPTSCKFQLSQAAEALLFRQVKELHHLRSLVTNLPSVYCCECVSEDDKFLMYSDASPPAPDAPESGGFETCAQEEDENEICDLKRKGYHDAQHQGYKFFVMAPNNPS